MGKNIKRFLLLLIFWSSVALAQVPQCQLSFTNWTIPQISAYQDNRLGACTTWVLTYQVTGFTAVSLQFESATGALVPGTFQKFTGSIFTGFNPLTQTDCTVAAPNNCTAVYTGQVGWYRLNLQSVTGTGSISGVLKGYGNYGSLGGIVPCGNEILNPCSVGGLAAGGSAVVGNPVLIAGSGGGLVLFPGIWTPANGGPPVFSPNVGQLAAMATGPAGDGASVSGGAFLYPLAMGVYDGANGRNVRSASAINFPTSQTRTAVNSIGTVISEKGARIGTFANGTVGSAASASIAAEAGVRHVLDCLTYSAVSSGGATAATNTFLNVYDGTVGGTTLYSISIAMLAATATAQTVISPNTVCGLNLVGSTNTAMTVAFTLSAANVNQTVSFTNFNVD